MSGRICRTLAIVLGLVGCLWSTSAWSLPHPYFSKHPKQAKKLEELLQQTSLKALEPQPADLSIQLSDLQGKAHTLSQHRGKVLLLTRWATWCGACKAEMPFKVKLARTLQGQRFALIGISGEDRDTVAQYARQAPAMFPINLLDPKGLMQKFFPGGAIPVSILIDGWGWVVAMKTGGAQWDTTPYVNLHRFLMSVAPTEKQLKRREKVPAPRVEFVDNIRVQAGQTFSVQFKMNWTGEQDKYRRILFRLPKEKGLKVLGVSTSGISAEKGGNQRTYTLQMKALKPGEYDLDPILINYWIKDYDSHFQTSIGDMSIQVRGLLSSGSKKIPSWALGSLGAAIFLLFFAILVVRQKKNHQRIQEHQNARREQELKDLHTNIEQLVQAQRNHDWTRMFSAARNIRQAYLGQKDSQLNELDEAYQYGGQKPQPEDIKAIFCRMYDDLLEEYPAESAALERLQTLSE